MLSFCPQTDDIMNSRFQFLLFNLYFKTAHTKARLQRHRQAAVHKTKSASGTLLFWISWTKEWSIILSAFLPQETNKSQKGFYYSRGNITAALVGKCWCPVKGRNNSAPLNIGTKAKFHSWLPLVLYCLWSNRSGAQFGYNLCLVNVTTLSALQFKWRSSLPCILKYTGDSLKPQIFHYHLIK